MKPRRTDYGTIILHWLLVAAIGVAFSHGPAHRHRSAGQGLDQCVRFHPAARQRLDLAYRGRSRAGRRVDRACDLSGPVGAQPARPARQGPLARSWPVRSRCGSAASACILTWIFFGSMVTLIISGGLLYFGVFAGYNALMVHWLRPGSCRPSRCLHILTHFRIGGMSQLLRIFRPERLPPPPPRLDAVELLTLLAERTSQRRRSRRMRRGRRCSRSSRSSDERHARDERCTRRRAPGLRPAPHGGEMSRCRPIRLSSPPRSRSPERRRS